MNFLETFNKLNELADNFNEAHDNFECTNIFNHIEDFLLTSEELKEEFYKIDDIDDLVDFIEDNSNDNLWEYLRTENDIENFSKYILDNNLNTPGATLKDTIETAPAKSTESYPAKGDLINIVLVNTAPTFAAPDLYRVLSIDRSIAEVVAMHDYSTSIQFNSSDVNEYFGGTLDNYFTSVYKSFNDKVKAAIIPTNITQYQYEYDDLVYNATTHASYADYSTKVERSSSTRYVYALDVEDIETYFNGIYSETDLLNLFCDDLSEYTYQSFWFRSAEAGKASSVCAWGTLGIFGEVFCDNVGSDYAARPVFHIDLSKIDWTKAK